MRSDLWQAFDPSTTPRRALEHWNADPATLQGLSQSSNFVYRFREPSGPERYLRLIHRKHRSRQYIEAELEFIQYLKSEGCDVAAPVQSKSGNLLEVIETGPDVYYAAAFQTAPGDADKWGKDADNRRILHDQGRALGRIHVRSMRFQPQYHRFHWKVDGFARFIGPHLPDSQAPVKREIEAVLAWVERQPKAGQTYGLIHGDFGIVNYRRQGQTLTAFDFDDCCYQFFAFDAAITLRPASRLPLGLRRAYLECFLNGYSAEREPLGMGSVELSWFSRLCSVGRYLNLTRNWDLVHLTPEQEVELKNRYQAVVEPVNWE